MNFNVLPFIATYRKAIFLLLFTFFFVNLGCAQKQLSKKEKVADFEYLYEEFKASYPYFGINKRVYQIDWLANKKKYLKTIKNTKNDTAFFKAINDILNDLHNGHTDAYPTIIYNYFYTGYQQGVAQDSVYYNYVKELEKTDSIRSQYWKAINHKLFFSDTDSDEVEVVKIEEETPKNIEAYFIDSLSTAIVHIKSFSYEYVTQDADTLKSLFHKTTNYKNLIIDIQGNDGGSTEYWLQNMIPYLIKDTITFPVIYAFKNSKRLQKFKPDYFENTLTYEEIGLPNMPEELTNGSYVFRKENTTITPISNDYTHVQNIYLLVDNAVFSSSETLAYFCKATNFATVAGEKTSGDGVGTDPLLLTLPNSGIVIRFTGEMGLNPDGSANDETKTVPDLILKASNKEERRKKLLDYIKQKN
ncbi:S41 family peptidase [uncultured Kordia sp.]|uniref:S41 family peptidase n=1 Tax=uncultured Kordia sp. TaxID=507699 RepID=UPI002610B591|nr:S41 family peptidase [uncultured Kordia sp.]